MGVLMNKKVNVYSFNDECYVYLNDYKQLQQKINQLERKKEILEATQYCPYDKDCGKLYDCTKEEYQKMCEANVDLMAKIDQLETNRDEAIELLSKGVTFCENDSQLLHTRCLAVIEREQKVLEILKGSNK